MQPTTIPNARMMMIAAAGGNPLLSSLGKRILAAPITTSGSIFIPAGVKHCPLGINRVWRPFTFHALSLASTYKAKV